MSTASELLTQLRAIGVQLTLDGETLRLNAPKGALTPDLQAQLKAGKPEILELLRTMQQNSSIVSSLSIPRVERQERMPLSYAQQRIWFLQQMDPESVAYNLVAVMLLRGKLDVQALEGAFGAMVARHEDLRTRFIQRDGTPFTVIDAQVDFELIQAELPRQPGEPLNNAVSRFVRATTQKPFNLETGPLFSTYLLQTDPDEHVAVIALHHIVSDGWSMGVLVRELAENYRALYLKQAASLVPLSIQYSDYSAWQREWLASGVLDRQMNYWRKQLEGAPAVVMFPPDHERVTQGESDGHRSKLVIPSRLVAQIESFGRAHDATLFMTLLSAFMLLLSRYSGQTDVVVGSPSANRTRAELSDLIGFFVNNLVLRAQVDNGINFLELLKRVRESTLGAYENQDAPFDHLVRTLETDRNPDFAPLFQTMFILQNFPLEDLQLPDLQVLPLEIDAATARFDLTVEAYPVRGELWIYFDYRSDLYEQATIEGIQNSFVHVLEFVTPQPHVNVDEVPLMSQKSLNSLVQFGNETSATIAPTNLFLDAFASFAETIPAKVALRAGTQSLSYAELHAQSQELAIRLMSVGVSKGSLVPVCLTRSANLLIALLAVLKAGAAYVPLDPIYPRQRILGILEDVQPSVLISETSLLNLLGEFAPKSLVLDELSHDEVQPPLSRKTTPSIASEDLAYVIFTSGSTGKPKGVCVSHGALANFLESMRQTPGFHSDDRILAVTTVSFDIAGLELFLPLYAGGEVVLALTPGDLPTLIDDLEREKPTVMQATPALWQMLLSAGWSGIPRLKALCGGEALTPQLARDLLPRVETLWNMYGPTETTIWSSALKLENAEGTSVPIGGPIRNTRFYVLDSHLRPVPRGVAGELHIGGEGLASGYFNRPELTAERFVNSPFLQDVRLYRTGDLVRQRSNGNLQFLGRADFQVKLRGFRIELGEIEHALRQQPEISEAVVLLREDNGQKELVAYFVLRPGMVLSYARLKQRLRERIPEYMVPSSSLALAVFPRLPNGKLDRSKLPAPLVQTPGESETFLNQPLNPTQAAIFRVFQELLNGVHIGVDQRFFDMGAHSLMLVKAHARLRNELDSELRLVSFFQHPSIAALAAHIDRNRGIVPETAHAR